MTLPCSEKTRYSSGAAARKAIDTIKRRNRRRDGDIPKRAYPCEYCHSWHLTSQDYQDAEGYG